MCFEESKLIRRGELEAAEPLSVVALLFLKHPNSGTHFAEEASNVLIEHYVRNRRRGISAGIQFFRSRKRIAINRTF